VEKETRTAKERGESCEQEKYDGNLHRYYLYNYKKKIDLNPLLSYCSNQQKEFILLIENLWRLPMMKLVLRIFALSIVVVGGVASILAPKDAAALASHQSATASMPSPACGGHMGCYASPSGN
jgi:hypothetical protein